MARAGWSGAAKTATVVEFEPFEGEVPKTFQEQQGEIAEAELIDASEADPVLEPRAVGSEPEGFIGDDPALAALKKRWQERIVRGAGAGRRFGCLSGRSVLLD